jgi:pancreatic triacylglycerol lipase
MWCFSVCLLYIIFTLSLIDLEATGIEKNIFSVKYKTYTKDNPNKEVELRDVKNFNDGMKTKFVIHGWLSIPLDEGIKVKDATFKWQHDVGRVVLVDWRGLNSNPIYNDVVKKTVPEIAEDLTKELIYVQNKGNGKIELVGHSLGAHIAGQAGRLFKLNTGKKIDSIIGKVVYINMQK